MIKEYVCVYTYIDSMDLASGTLEHDAVKAKTIKYLKELNKVNK